MEDWRPIWSCYFIATSTMQYIITHSVAMNGWLTFL